MHTTRDIVDYVHTDLWGEAPVISIGGGKCLLIVVDDFSRKVWVYTLKSKDEIIFVFLQWKSKLEIQTRKKVKYLRLDNGTEFCSGAFATFF